MRLRIWHLLVAVIATGITAGIARLIYPDNNPIGFALAWFGVTGTALGVWPMVSRVLVPGSRSLWRSYRLPPKPGVLRLLLRIVSIVPYVYAFLLLVDFVFLVPFVAAFLPFMIWASFGWIK